MKKATLFVLFFIFVSSLVAKSSHRVDSVITLFNGKDLTNWEITDYGTQGPVIVLRGKLIISAGDGASGVTWDGQPLPKMNYEVTLEASRIQGQDFFCGLTFPVNEDYLTLVVGGWGGSVVGLSSLDGRDAANNETGTLKTFSNGRWYHIRLCVQNDRIEAWINDLKIVDCNIKGRELSLRPEVLLARPFGLTTWNTTGAVRNLRLKKLSDKP